ncbi:hypothetical protein Tco_1492284 [Tanacetum coccineum]
MSFHQALDLIFELDEAAVRCTRDILRQSDCLDWFSEIPWVIPTFVVIEVEDIIAEFFCPSRWKELSKEMSSKILPCGDGSCWKTFKPIASWARNPSGRSRGMASVCTNRMVVGREELGIITVGTYGGSQCIPIRLVVGFGGKIVSKMYG